MKFTVPVGVLAVPASVSVTVALHNVAVPAATLLGEQLTLVEVERVVTLTGMLPLLPVWVKSPG